MPVTDPLGLTRCASCTNAFSFDRRPDGTCAHCGDLFDRPTEGTVWLVEMPQRTLREAGLMPSQTSRGDRALANDDDDEHDRLAEMDDAMAAAFGDAWVAAAESLAERYGVQVEAIWTDDQAEADEWSRRNPDYPSRGPDVTVVEQISQHVHGEVGVDVDDETGEWRVWL